MINRKYTEIETIDVNGAKPVFKKKGQRLLEFSNDQNPPAIGLIDINNFEHALHYKHHDLAT